MHPAAGESTVDGVWTRLWRCVRHRWADESDTRKVIDAAMLERLASRVAASERRHTGEVRIYVEADGIELPLDFDPDEADEIAEELRSAAEAARALRSDAKPGAKPGKKR